MRRRVVGYHPMGAFPSVSAQRYGVTREEPIYWPGRAELHEAEQLQHQVDYMIAQATRDAHDRKEVFYFAASEKHMQWLRERKPFEFRGNFGGWVGIGVPLTTEPDTPIIPDATHEARVEFPAGTMPLQARQLRVDAGVVWMLTSGATLFAEGVVIGAIRELKPAQAGK